MATRFFEHQEAARRSTSWLIVLFGCAVVGIVLLLYALAVALTGEPVYDAYGQITSARLAWWQPELLVQVALATLAVVAGGSLYKIAQLRGGGAVVAEQLGGRLVPSDTRDPDARKLLNVVEEMAIASGTPTPPVYLLADEDGINAFAAGFTPSDAVVGVTRGCMRRLSRDELQGVVAHEFSHILNGDMRLNIRLMGFVHGILLLGIIGYFLLRSSMFAGGGRRSSRDSSGAVILAAGLGLMIVGFVGTFFGNLIKASVSRQREFLADASAVQFTRNPNGLAGALAKIAGLDAGSVLSSPAAPEASHLFFSQGLRGGLQALFSTHPPLAERIQRLEPGFQAPGRVQGEAISDLARPATSASSLAGASVADGRADALADAPAGPAIEQIGEPTLAHLDQAHRLVEALPRAVVEASHEAHGARAVVYALLIDSDAGARRRQLERLDGFAEPGIADETRRLLADVERLAPSTRLPIVDIALPALRNLSPRQYAAFHANVRALVEADERIDLFEWTLSRVLLAHLAPHFEHLAKPPRRKSLRALSHECSVALSVLARLGSPGEDAVRAAFERGAGELAEPGLELLPEERCALDGLDRALDGLARAKPRAAERILHACAVCIAADGIVSDAQGEVLRALADTLGCPMPPLLPGQRLV